jgi:hypothetical protein
MAKVYIGKDAKDKKIAKTPTTKFKKRLYLSILTNIIQAGALSVNHWLPLLLGLFKK